MIHLFKGSTIEQEAVGEGTRFAVAVDVGTGGGYIARPIALPLPSRDTGLPRWRNW